MTTYKIHYCHLVDTSLSHLAEIPVPLGEGLIDNVLTDKCANLLLLCKSLTAFQN